MSAFCPVSGCKNQVSTKNDKTLVRRYIVKQIQIFALLYFVIFCVLYTYCRKWSLSASPSSFVQVRLFDAAIFKFQLSYILYGVAPWQVRACGPVSQLTVAQLCMFPDSRIREHAATSR